MTWIDNNAVEDNEMEESRAFVVKCLKVFAVDAGVYFTVGLTSDGRVLFTSSALSVSR